MSDSQQQGFGFGVLLWKRYHLNVCRCLRTAIYCDLCFFLFSPGKLLNPFFYVCCFGVELGSGCGDGREKVGSGIGNHLGMAIPQGGKIV